MGMSFQFWKRLDFLITRAMSCRLLLNGFVPFVKKLFPTFTLSSVTLCVRLYFPQILPQPHLKPFDLWNMLFFDFFINWVNLLTAFGTSSITLLWVGDGVVGFPWESTTWTITWKHRKIIAYFILSVASWWFSKLKRIKWKSVNVLYHWIIINYKSFVTT